MTNFAAPIRLPASDGTSTKRGRGVPVFRSSFRLARVAGIDVYVHATFLLLIGFVAFADLVAGRGVGGTVQSIFLILAVFGTVVLHELGHALMARRFGIGTRDITLLPIGTRDITLLPIGGVARLDKLPDQPRHQLLVSLAGPAVNVVIALGLFVVLLLLGSSVGSGPFDVRGSFLSRLMWINVSLAAFNLLPGFPMDGGRILRALLAMRLAPERATQIAARVGQGVAVVFGLVGLFWNPFLVVIAVFVWLGAGAEHSVSTARVALAGLSVRDAMITDFRTLSPTDPLSRAVELTLAGFQQDFPVTDGARLKGVLTHGDVLRGLAEGGASLSVERAMQPDLRTASPTESLEVALTRIREGAPRVLMVVENEQLVGLLTLGQVGELIALGATGHARSPAPVKSGAGARA
jgi:Zn-dependent protease/CBS domain-containing protein